MRQIEASAPPHTITSASPHWMRRIESPIACAPVAQAVTTAWFGPLKPYLIEICPEARLISALGMKKGHAPRALLVQLHRGICNRRKASDAGADQHARADPVVIAFRRPA